MRVQPVRRRDELLRLRFEEHVCVLAVLGQLGRVGAYARMLLQGHLDDLAPLPARQRVDGRQHGLGRRGSGLRHQLNGAREEGVLSVLDNLGDALVQLGVDLLGVVVDHVDGRAGKDVVELTQEQVLPRSSQLRLWVLVVVVEK